MMLPLSTPIIRRVAPQDNAEMARIIRAVMPEFGAGGSGFAIHDPEVDDMFGAYQAPRHFYAVIELEGKIHGGGGIAPLAGADGSICELRKMYFLPAVRGLGLGHKMLALCLETACSFGFAQCYLETLSGMDAAYQLYRKNGFQDLSKPLGCTGHTSCDRWMSRVL